MILIDTSAWIDFLRKSDSLTRIKVREALSKQTATCDAVRMEVLAGARSDIHFRQLQSLLVRSTSLDLFADDYDQAALIYRTCRQNGETPRKLLDCLIAAVAIRHKAAVLHADKDFDVIAKYTDLEIA